MVPDQGGEHYSIVLGQGGEHNNIAPVQGDEHNIVVPILESEHHKNGRKWGERGSKWQQCAVVKGKQKPQKDKVVLLGEKRLPTLRMR